MVTYLFDASLKLKDGTVLYGPITVSEDKEYLFVQKSSAIDVYFNLKKDGMNWYCSGGPSYEPPNEYINQIGEQIDKYYEERV
jgi:hypothetical protein